MYVACDVTATSSMMCVAISNLSSSRPFDRRQTNLNRNTFRLHSIPPRSVAADWRHVLASFVRGGGRNLRHADSARKVPGMGAPSLHKGEQDALQKFALPPSVVVPPDQLSKEFNTKQRDEPTVESVWEAVNKPPAGAPSSGARNAPPPRQGNVLSSPRRVSNVGETCHNASPWRQPATFTLETPYPIATSDSRFADFAEDKAALAAVAFTAGRSGGRSARRHELKQGLDAAGPSEPEKGDDGTRLQLSGRPRGGGGREVVVSAHGSHESWPLFVT